MSLPPVEGKERWDAVEHPKAQRHADDGVAEEPSHGHPESAEPPTNEDTIEGTEKDIVLPWRHSFDGRFAFAIGDQECVRCFGLAEGDDFRDAVDDGYP